MQEAQQRLAQFQQQLQAQAGGLSTASHATQQLSQSMTGLTQSLQTSTQAASTFGSVWQNALAVAGGLGIVTSVQAITRAMVDFVTSTVQVGARLEAVRVSLGALAGSSAAGVQQFNQLFETAQRLGVAFDPLIRGWRILTAAASQTTLPLAEQQRLMTALATEARRVGATNAELERAFLAVGQMASKGVVSMEELRRQLAEALPTAFAAAARGMGMTTEELIKLVETGTLRFVPMARALSRGFEEMQASAQQLGTTAQQEFNKLGNAWTAFKDALASSGVNEYMANFAKNVREAVEWMTRLVRSTGGAQGPGLGDLGISEADMARLRVLGQNINTLRQQIAAGGPMAETRQARLEELEQERQEILNRTRATQDEAEAQRKVTQEANRTNAAREQEADYIENIRKTLDTIHKEQEQFRERARVAPQVFGTPTGTPEQQIEYRQREQQALGGQLEKLAEQVRQRPAGAQLPADIRQQVQALDAQYGTLGRTIDAIKDKEREREKAEREAQQAREKDAKQTVEAMRDQLRQQEQDAEHAAQTIDRFALAGERTRQRQFEQLEQLAERYGMTKQARDLDTASELLNAQAGTEQEEAAKKLYDALEPVLRIESQLLALRKEAAATEREGLLAVKRATEETAALQTLQENLERVRLPARGGGFPFELTREELRLQQQARENIRTPAGQEQAQQLQEAYRQQLQINYAVGLFEQLGSSVGQSWTSALSAIADHTKTVSEAFREMARSILQSIGQMAAQETFKTVFAVLGGLLRAYLGGSSPSTGGGGTVSTGLVPADWGGSGLQHGGVVHRPSFHLLAEGGQPEAVVNRGQMGQLMEFARASTPSAGGQAAGGISIHNYPSRQAAEEGAARERALGKQAIVNEVLSDLSAGEGSRIGRAIRTINR